MTNEEKSMNSATPGTLPEPHNNVGPREYVTEADSHQERLSPHGKKQSFRSLTRGLRKHHDTGPDGVLPRRVFAAHGAGASRPIAGSSLDSLSRPAVVASLHPDGNSDPAQSIPVRADADGVARFQAVRPAQQDSVDRLALDCTDANGISQTNLVDLRSEATFAPRAFDPR